MLTDAFYRQLAGFIKGELTQGGSLYIAIGSGHADWDRNPPILNRITTQLYREVQRKIVDQKDINYLTDKGEMSSEPTPQLNLQTLFSPDEGRGALRECGLLFGEGDKARLIAYFIHPRIEKEAGASLQRSMTLDLIPGRALAQEIPTRYLGNSKTEELHDLENENANCQVNEIRIDRRHYFRSVEDARLLGYDYCAFCFGRDLSER
jgi:hypothetical protein